MNKTISRWMLPMAVLLGFSPLSVGETFTTFDVPKAIYTYADAINASGQIIGFYVDSTNVHGFLRQADGSFVVVDPPGANGTIAIAINGSGQISGYYEDASSVLHSFLRQPDGTYVTIDPPSSDGTIVGAMNDAGQIVGFFQHITLHYHYGKNVGYSRGADGAFVNFHVGTSDNTYAYGVN